MQVQWYLQKMNVKIEDDVIQVHDVKKLLHKAESLPAKPEYTILRNHEFSYVEA